MTDPHNVQPPPAPHSHPEYVTRESLPKLTPLPEVMSDAVNVKAVEDSYRKRCAQWVGRHRSDIESIQRTYACIQHTLDTNPMSAAQAEPKQPSSLDAKERRFCAECDGSTWHSADGRCIRSHPAPGPDDEPHPTNCACPDCEPDPILNAQSTPVQRLQAQIVCGDRLLADHVRDLNGKLRDHLEMLNGVMIRLDALEEPKQEPAPSPQPPPSDICEEWADAVKSSRSSFASDFRRLGLPERQAVCDAARGLAADRYNPLRMGEVILTLHALDAKEKTNGKK